MPGAMLESVLNSQLLGQLCIAMCHTHIGLLLQTVRFESTDVREHAIVMREYKLCCNVHAV